MTAGKSDRIINIMLVFFPKFAFPARASKKELADYPDKNTVCPTN